MSLTIVSVAYPLAPAAADCVGGAEQVLVQLDAALVRAGHRSIVVACNGSQLAGELAAFEAPSCDQVDCLVRAESRARELLSKQLCRQSIDLVHVHAVDFRALLPQNGTPTLVTLHMPRTYYSSADLHGVPTNVWMNCVSKAQQAAFRDVSAVITTIENGVPVPARAPARLHGRRFALWLGRICPEKAPHAAIDAAERARTPLILAGRVFPYPKHVEYFRTYVAQRMHGHCRFVGPVAGKRKRALLRHARCLIVSTEIHETSSLVAREALAAGTPVVALRTPALEQLIEHGVTGFLVDDEREMAEAIAASIALDSQACFQAARTRCNLDQMAAHYLQLYEKLAKSGSRNASAGQLDGTVGSCSHF